MYPSVKREVPKFIENYLVFCDCFIDINKQKSCWVLTRNLKFLEFCRKQLVASIDLQTTCLSKLKKDIQNYNGPKGKWYETSNIPTEPATLEDAKQVSMGKYVFHALNVYKVYVIIQCWDKCVVLKRLPNFKGFELKAQYEDFLSYKIIHGPIKYCAMLEIKFKNHDILQTDFEDEITDSDKQDVDNTQIEMRQLLERIRSAKTEYQLHQSITAQAFHKVQSNLTLGQPFLRSFKLEEKQILSRCGDIWKRFTVHEDLIIGVSLVNQCASPNLSIIRNITPVLQAIESPEKIIQLQYRLFQLKLKFDQLDSLKCFLESEDEEIQKKIWCSNNEMKILPESYVVLLIKIKLSEVISLKQSPLFLNYEVVKRLDIIPDRYKSTFIMPLQLFLQNLDFHKLLFEQRSQCQLTFLPHTIHQDFLTIAMTSHETNLNIIFESCKDLEIFEIFVAENLNFINPTTSFESIPENINFNTIYYNKSPSSLWFGSLILRLKEETEDDNGQCLTKWRLYCQSSEKTLLLIKTFLSDLLTIKCNIISITSYDNDRTSSKYAVEFENALRLELQQLQEILSTIKSKNSEERLKNLKKLCQLQMNSDIIAKDVMEKKINL